MTIVHVCLNSIVTDGWSYQDNLLPKYHKRLGFNTVIITSMWVYNTKGEVVVTEKTNYVNEDQVRIIRLKAKNGNAFSKFKRFNGLYSTLEKIKPNIIFLHDFQCLDSLTVCKYIQKHGDTVLYADNHADFTNSARNFFSRVILHGMIWKGIAKKLNRYTRKFYGVLPARVSFLSSVYHIPREKCELLIMGADDDLVNDKNTEMLSKSIRTENNVGEKDFLIVTGGKIDQWKKETMELMKAVDEIKDSRLKLIIFGSVGESIKESFFSLLSERVRYVGWIDSKQSYSYFSAANLVCFPGRHSVFWEQVVAQKKPMMCKRIDGTDHVDIGGNVVFLEKSSAEEIKHKIVDLLSKDYLYSQLCEKANSKQSLLFLYSNIAKTSIEQ